MAALRVRGRGEKAIWGIEQFGADIAAQNDVRPRDDRENEANNNNNGNVSMEMDSNKQLDSISSVIPGCTHCPSKQHPLPFIFISSFHRTAPFDQTITTELQILQKAVVPSFALPPFLHRPSFNHSQSTTTALKFCTFEFKIWHITSVKERGRSKGSTGLKKEEEEGCKPKPRTKKKSSNRRRCRSLNSQQRTSIQAETSSFCCELPFNPRRRRSLKSERRQNLSRNVVVQHRLKTKNN
ncbi:hypothetical protein WN944_018555 [Citrus x changshan-huyou]|uniref:Uncharacterized protein n=1 Tax=Citrus x changshan-huyou TaxID=2935761 RepID=A0AAP0LYB9_9ROSI